MLNHFDNYNPVMVDVSEKAETQRTATAEGYIYISQETIDAIKTSKIKKGDVLFVSELSGINASKFTSLLIPLTHNINIENTKVNVTLDESNSRIRVLTTVKTTGKTGVEMEALTATSVALLTVYDMCKSVQKDMIIKDILLISKSGGKSGDYHCE